MEEEYKLKIYRSPNYPIDGVEQECFVIYIYERGIYLVSNNGAEKILQKPTFTLDDSNIDSYVLSRGFEQVLRFDKNTIEWFNGYDTPEKRKYLKEKISTIKQDIKKKSFNKFITNRTVHTMYVHLNILQSIL